MSFLYISLQKIVFYDWLPALLDMTPEEMYYFRYTGNSGIGFFCSYVPIEQQSMGADSLKLKVSWIPMAVPHGAWGHLKEKNSCPQIISIHIKISPNLPISA